MKAFRKATRQQGEMALSRGEMESEDDEERTRLRNVILFGGGEVPGASHKRERLENQRKAEETEEKETKDGKDLAAGREKVFFFLQLLFLSLKVVVFPLLTSPPHLSEPSEDGRQKGLPIKRPDRLLGSARQQEEEVGEAGGVPIDPRLNNGNDGAHPFLHVLRGVTRKERGEQQGRSVEIGVQWNEQREEEREDFAGRASREERRGVLRKQHQFLSK